MPTLSPRLQTLITDYLGVGSDKVTPTARFVEDLGGDSLDVVAIIIAIEKEYGISIPDADIDRVATVQDAAALVERFTATSTQVPPDRLGHAAQRDVANPHPAAEARPGNHEV